MEYYSRETSPNKLLKLSIFLVAPRMHPFSIKDENGNVLVLKLLDVRVKLFLHESQELPGDQQLRRPRVLLVDLEERAR